MVLLIWIVSHLQTNQLSAFQEWHSTEVLNSVLLFFPFITSVRRSGLNWLLDFTAPLQFQVPMHTSWSFLEPKYSVFCVLAKNVLPLCKQKAGGDSLVSFMYFPLSLRIFKEGQSWVFLLFCWFFSIFPVPHLVSLCSPQQLQHNQTISLCPLVLENLVACLLSGGGEG